MDGCLCNERLKAKTEGSKLLAFTGLHRREDLSSIHSKVKRIEQIQ
jgi:hypothetical protein